VPADRRNVSTVFQHFALFPHMSVGQNVEYSLKIRKVPADERKRRAEAMLALVRLDGKYDRRIHQMSGGERQRAALARSLVMGPAILLLDEPLGALDERLRLDMQLELIELRRKTGGTFILVTHSQEEAITMSDRIVLMRAGAIEQIGSPKELFSSPRTEFAARFMGFENVLHGTLRGWRDDCPEIDVNGAVLTGRAVGDRAALQPGDKVFAAIRAEHLHLAATDTAPNRIHGTSGVPVYKGRFNDVPFISSIGDIIVRFGEAEQAIPPEADLSFAPEHCVVGAAEPESAR
jgi:ABC-type Fe3+/spermidine/putrescine transport system ATPase subunit